MAIQDIVHPKGHKYESAPDFGASNPSLVVLDLNGSGVAYLHVHDACDSAERLLKPSGVLGIPDRWRLPRSVTELPCLPTPGEGILPKKDLARALRVLSLRPVALCFTEPPLERKPNLKGTALLLT